MVVGVQFGWSLSKCKSILDKRFNNGEDSYQLNKNVLTYYDIDFANETFNYVIFSFQNDAHIHTSHQYYLILALI